MNKGSLKKAIGENIREARIKKDMSIDELSELLELSPGFVGLIERGQRGATAYTLYKLSEIFQTKIDNFFSGSSQPVSLKEENPVNVKREKVQTILYGLNTAELDFVIDMIKNLKQMNAAQTGSDVEGSESYETHFYADALGADDDDDLDD